MAVGFVLTAFLFGCGSDSDTGGSDEEHGKPVASEIHRFEFDGDRCYVYDEDGEGGGGISCLPPNPIPSSSSTTTSIRY